MLSAEALERNEGMNRKKGVGLGKTAVVCVLGTVWRAGVQWGPASIPAVSLGLVAGPTWMDGGTLVRQHLSEGLTRHRYFPHPQAARGKAKSLRSVPLSP